MALTEKLTLIAQAIREKTGTTELLKLDEMDDLIAAIQSRLPEYSGSVSVSPSHEKQTLSTKDMSVYDDISVEPINVVEVSNTSEGKTLII